MFQIFTFAINLDFRIGFLDFLGFFLFFGFSVRVRLRLITLRVRIYGLLHFEFEYKLWITDCMLMPTLSKEKMQLYIKNYQKLFMRFSAAKILILL